MSDFVSALIRLTVRIVLVLMGLVFALSLFFAAAVLAVVWGIRRLWARVTGRPVEAWVFRVDPVAGWNRFYRANPWTGNGHGTNANERSPSNSQPEAAPENRLSASRDWRERRPKDVTDVEPK